MGAGPGRGVPLRRSAPPASLIAERAVRYLRSARRPVTSREMLREVLATQAPDEDTARRVLATALGDDPRLAYDGATWRPAVPGPAAPEAPETRTLLAVRGERPHRGAPFRLASVAAVRVEAGEVTAACGGDVVSGPPGEDLCRAVRETLEDATPVLHAPPGARAALERWLGEPLAPAVCLRRLAVRRVGLRPSHTVEDLAARLHLSWRDDDDPVAVTELLEAALSALRRPGESLADLAVLSSKGDAPLDWSRFAFGRDFLRSLPAVPGTYRFLAADGRLLYVGKSNNLARRVASYFREGVARPERVKRLLRDLHRVEVEPVGSDLEALLREAAAIARRAPEQNVQRRVHPRGRRQERLRSVLLLEPAAPPFVLLAFLLRDGRLLDRVAIGPRGGGLRRIRTILEERYFGDGTALPSSRPEERVDVELVARWLAGHRDRVVAFDPTDLRSPQEVVDRLAWFLHHGPLLPEGPVVPRR